MEAKEKDAGDGACGNVLGCLFAPRWERDTVYGARGTCIVVEREEEDPDKAGGRPGFTRTGPEGAGSEGEEKFLFSFDASCSRGPEEDCGRSGAGSNLAFDLEVEDST